MNTKQQKFVTEYLKWGIPVLAYANAYNKPDPNGRAIESAANRLMRHPEVKQAIHDAEDRIRHQVEREIADRQALDVFTIEQKRHLLKQIATGAMLVEQHYKGKDCRQCTQFVRPTINQMLRAIDLDNRMSAHYPSPQQPKAVSSLPPLKETSIGQHLATTDNKIENTNDETRLPLTVSHTEFGRGIGGQPRPDSPEEQQPATTDNKTDNTPTITHDELMELLYPKEEKLQHLTTSYNNRHENIQRE